MNILQVHSPNISTLDARILTAIEEGQILVSLKEKFHSKLTSWKAWTLSQVGEMVLIKSNLTGVPLFTMEGINPQLHS